MKILKILSIIGIVISSIGMLGAFFLIVEEDSYGLPSLLIYGYFLALSISAIGVTKTLK